MLKTLVLALSLLGFLSAGSAVAEDKMASMKCTDADMATMETKMKGMMDTDKQKMAMGEMDMAKKMMANKDMDGCQIHMNKAMDSMDMMKK
jgi:hypothetical protein